MSLKKNISIFLLSVYLIAATEIHQLLKLPVLFHHYVEHKQKDNSIFFGRFLFIHYALSDDQDGDKDKDMKLPFKSKDECVSSSALFFTLTSNNFISEPIYSEERKITIFNEDFINNTFLSSIWQPPKFS